MNGTGGMPCVPCANVLGLTAVLRRRREHVREPDVDGHITALRVPVAEVGVEAVGAILDALERRRHIGDARGLTAVVPQGLALRFQFLPEVPSSYVNGGMTSSL